ncbi:MAG: lactate racemase domain-containing protein [Pirellulaceae bacterium]|nr:lactate racemase domain-containing protein [Pirellulaceae bacterium]
MSQQLRYGDGNHLELAVPPVAVVADWTELPFEPLSDTPAAVAAALHDPLDFPSISLATIPGDRIAIALENAVPQADQVLAGVVHALLSGAASPSEITVLVADDDADVAAAIPSDVRDEMRFVRHHAEEQDELAYLAASADGEPIYLNRELTDADVVLPIGVLRDLDSLGYSGVYGSVFPQFADARTQKRFWSPESRDPARRKQEADEAAWLLGAQFTIQVAPAPSGAIVRVLAGDCRAVEREGASIVRSLWRLQAPRRAKLVVAAVDGPPALQTWDNVGRALHAAMNVADDDGAIVLCTDLAEPPGPALQRLASPELTDEDLQAIRTSDSPDAMSAALLAELRGRSHVYLLSQLDENDVEDLGIGHVPQPDDVTHLSQRCESCILLGDAQFASPYAADN